MKIRSRLTYANVVATLALLFAMSGGAFAASHYIITSPKQISPKVIKKLKGKRGKRGPAGKAGLQGKAGPAGKEGAPGKEGPVGPSEVYEVELSKSTTEVAADTEKTLTLANLPAGSYAIYGKATMWPRETQNATSYCVLKAGSDVDQSWEFTSTTSTWFLTVNTQLTHTFTSTGTVTMSCSATEKWALIGADSEEADTRIVAIRIGAQHKTTAEAS